MTTLDHVGASTSSPTSSFEISSTVSASVFVLSSTTISGSRRRRAEPPPIQRLRRLDSVDGAGSGVGAADRPAGRRPATGDRLWLDGVLPESAPVRGVCARRALTQRASVTSDARSRRGARTEYRTAPVLTTAHEPRRSRHRAPDRAHTPGQPRVPQDRRLALRHQAGLGLRDDQRRAVGRQPGDGALHRAAREGRRRRRPAREAAARAQQPPAVRRVRVDAGRAHRAVHPHDPRRHHARSRGAAWRRCATSR